MPFESFGTYRFVVADYERRLDIWPIVSERYREQYGEDDIIEQAKVSEGLKFIFATLVELFVDKVSSIKSASFFVFVHKNNERSTELLFEQLAGFKIAHPELRADDLAVDRRVYKVILEQLTLNDLTHEEGIDQEIVKYVDRYVRDLGELLYIGNQIYFYKYMISKNDFMKGCLKLTVLENGNVAYVTVPPFMEVLDGIVEQFKEDANYVTDHPFIEALYATINNEFGISCSDAVEILQATNPLQEFGYVDLDQAIQVLSNDPYNYSKEGLEKFYAGLTISMNNALSVEDSFLRSQNNNRYLYRPILEVNINGSKYYKLGGAKYMESYSSIVRYSLPYGQLPKEWLTSKSLRKLMGQAQNNNDKTLEDPICNMLSQRNLVYDRNIKSLLTKNYSRNFPIEIKGVGEIDIIFFQFIAGKCNLFVCECKNNRFRDDFYNWRRDYSNFLKSYEAQLSRKVEFVKDNLEKIKYHFVRKTSDQNLFDGFDLEVHGIFIVNAPTLYMYDGVVEVYNYKTFPEFLDGTYQRVIFLLNNEDEGNEVQLKYPYLRNLREMIYK
jgi:hypothetical protein